MALEMIDAWSGAGMTAVVLKTAFIEMRVQIRLQVAPLYGKPCSAALH